MERSESAQSGQHLSRTWGLNHRIEVVRNTVVIQVCVTSVAEAVAVEIKLIGIGGIRAIVGRNQLTDAVRLIDDSVTQNLPVRGSNYSEGAEPSDSRRNAAGDSCGPCPKPPTSNPSERVPSLLKSMPKACSRVDSL